MTSAELNVLLRKFSAVMAVEADRNRLASPRFKAADYFAANRHLIYGDLQKVFSAEALAKLDALSANCHWFISLAATSLFLAPDYPVSAGLVEQVVRLHRRIGAYEIGDDTYEKIAAGRFSELSKIDYAQAVTRGMIVFDVTDPEGDQSYVNPILVV